ncbi:MAG TPA: C4-dicarboxylate transporter DctA [Stellaceae bacterium]|nr:C4-dicarboxylate transporter DctA [Stellaceae bacterium]
MTSSQEPYRLTGGGRFGVFGQLWFQVLAGMVIGVLMGHFTPDIGKQMKPFGDLFISLIRMLIAPIIFCTIVHGVCGMNDMRKVGRVALKAIIYFEVITTIGLIFAMVAVNLWQPGVGMHIDPRAIDPKSLPAVAAHAHATGLSDYLLHIVPPTFTGAFTGGETLQIVFVSVLFAVALSALGPIGKPVVDFIEILSKLFFKIVGYVLYVAPLGAFGALAFTVATFGVGSLWSLSNLIVEFFVVSALFTVIVLGGVAWYANVNIFRLLYFIRDELLIVAATTTTESVLPQLMAKMRRAGCEESIVGLVVPTGYSFNLDGTCLYLATTSIFLAQATDTHLSLGQQLGLIIVLLLTSKGAAGVAGIGFVVLAATLASSGTIPVASVTLILGIHRILAEALTFVNAVGNCVSSVVVSKWEGAIDFEKLSETIGTRRAASLVPAAAMAKR